VELRPAYDALFAIDDAMGEVVAKATEPALAAIKLAWWRERLEELDVGKVPAEPRLHLAAEKLLVRNITGASLAGLEDGWATWVEAEPDFERVAARGTRLFELGSGLLGKADPMIAAAGRLYGCESARRKGLGLVHHPTGVLQQLAGHRFPRALRPLTMLASLAARDARRGPAIEPEGTPGRALGLICHRLTGRVV
jgi:15-cis-phytoene synthase